MKKTAVLALAVLVLAGLFLTAFSTAAPAQPVDRYERYDGGPPPPPRRAAPPPPPPMRHAPHGEGYFMTHLGIFEPNNEEPTATGGGLEGYDSGGSFDFGFGSRVAPILAVEGSFGAYSAENDLTGGDVGVVPLTIGIRLIIPNPIIEPYVGGGLGMYFASLEEPLSGIDDDDATIGGYASVGLDAWLNQRVALNFEGKYHWAEPTFNGFDVDVGGWTVNMGVRISFGGGRY